MCLGLCSSTTSDVCSNCFRVIKTTKQTSESSITYRQALRHILDEDGIQGLFARGLQTRFFAGWDLMSAGFWGKLNFRRAAEVQVAYKGHFSPSLIQVGCKRSSRNVVCCGMAVSGRIPASFRRLMNAALLCISSVACYVVCRELHA